MDALLRYLLELNDEDANFGGRAIHSLVNRLKNSNKSVKDLEYALANRTEKSNCVTIVTSLDGRIQLGRRKFFAHLVYCRIWRWPHLQSTNEVEPLEHCRYPFQLSNVSNNVRLEICINPYHYRLCIEPFYKFLHSLPSISSEDATKEEISSTNIEQPSSQECSVPEIKVSNVPLCFIIPYQETQDWCSIAYYELNCRVGEIFHAQSNQISVEGFFQPLGHPTSDNSRFCLGSLFNLNRNSSIEKTRLAIGKGLKLSYINEMIFIECISKSPIFIQSAHLNSINGFSLQTVLRMTSGFSLKIFDYADFSKQLSEAINQGFETVAEMVKMCSIRVSFAKGWGDNYYRKDITSTPCWIEIHLNGAFIWLDKILVKMGKPNYPISSVS